MRNKTYEKAVFAHPFTAAYWKCAFGELGSVKTLVLAALFVALRMAVKALKIPVGDNLSIFLTFIPNAVGAYLCGPVVGFLSGAVCDTLSFIIAPSGPYNPAFMFVEALGSFLFALPLYRSRVSAARLFLSRFLVVGICNLVLTPFFLAVMYGSKSFAALFSTRVVKNVVCYPIESLILCIVFAALVPVMKRAKVCAWIPGDRLK